MHFELSTETMPLPDLTAKLGKLMHFASLVSEAEPDLAFSISIRAYPMAPAYKQEALEPRDVTPIAVSAPVSEPEPVPEEDDEAKVAAIAGLETAQMWVARHPHLRISVPRDVTPVAVSAPVSEPAPAPEEDDEAKVAAIAEGLKKRAGRKKKTEEAAPVEAKEPDGEDWDAPVSAVPHPLTRDDMTAMLNQAAAKHKERSAGVRAIMKEIGGSERLAEVPEARWEALWLALDRVK